MNTDNIIDKSFFKSNINDEETTKYQIGKTLDIIANSVAKSLGPYGSTTIVEDSSNEHFMTKDGYTIIKNMEFCYEIPKTIHNIIKRISKTLVRTVGDGSTSSVVIANYFYKEICIFEKDFGLASQDIINILNELAIILEKYIKSNTVKINDKNFDEIITKIASISTNNSTETGKLICDIFKKVTKYGFINIESGKTNVDTYELVNGIEVNRGYINMIMANKPDKISYEYEKPLVFMCNDTLADTEMEKIAEWFGSICLKQDIPLVIIAQNYSESFKGFFHLNKQKHPTLPLVAIDMDCSTKRGKEKFEDLALSLDCKPFDKFNGIDNINDWTIDDLGSCERVIGDDLHSKFINGFGYLNNKEKIEDKIKELEDKYDTLNNIDDQQDRDIELFRIRERIAMLTCSMATLYVGGNSSIERNTRKFLFEDAVYACRSAIENGYVVGGNLIVPKIIYKDKDNIINDLLNCDNLSYLKDSNLVNYQVYNYLIKHIDDCFRSSFETVLKNANIDKDNREIIINKCISDNQFYNVKLRRFEDDDKTLVINSCETDIEIIKASFSIIGLLATSNQFITINPILARQPK